MQLQALRELRPELPLPLGWKCAACRAVFRECRCPQTAHGHLELESRASEDQGQGGLDLSGAALLRGASSEGEGPRSLHGAALVVEPEPMRARGLPPGADQHPQHPQHAQAEVFVLDSDDDDLPALSRD